jgi:ABC-type transporter Mla maintaining outer membrane lipid asymmetry ATPase subunit MlaF
MMEDLIRLEHISISSEDFEVLRDISLSFPKGLSTVIFGPSGCGKSTLLKTAAGILIPDSGSLLIGGKDFIKMSERELKEFRRLNGFVFQDAALFDNRTIYQNLSLPLEYHYPERSAEEIKARVVELLDQTGLYSQAYLRPAQLSTGERKLASFLRAIVTKPSLLFMDEPTLSVDGKKAGFIHETLRDMKLNGCTMISITHDQNLTSWLADYLVVMEGGRILESGTFDEVKKSANPAVQSVMINVLSEAASYDTDILGLLNE